MAETAQVTNSAAFEKGSLGKQVLLSIITLGLYPVYWTYKTAKMLDAGTNQSLIPILGIIPLVNVITFWQISQSSEAITDQSPIVVFLLFLVFPVVSWYWVQSGINATAAQ